MTTSELIQAMDAHDKEGALLQAVMTELGLDAKKIKAIRKAEAATIAARAKLAELMGEGVVETAPDQTVETAPETLAPETTDDEPAPETPAEDVKKGAK